MITLRDYQERGIALVREAYVGGARRVLFVLPTGGGKTVVAAWIVHAAIALAGGRVLFVAHRRELIAQAWAKLVRLGLAARDVGVVMAGVPMARRHDDDCPAMGDGLDDRELYARHGRRRPTARVQVASLDSLRARLDGLGEIGLIIVDEAHRSLAASYRTLLDRYPDACVLGLTATPYRADGKGLGDLYEQLVVCSTPRELIAAGAIVAPRCYSTPERPDLSGIKMRGGDYDAEQMGARMVELVGDVVDHWARRAEGRRTVAFACSVAHSQALTERFVAAGVAAEHLDGTTPKDVRGAILERLERGETRVVSNCGVLCEGWDQPAVKCAILARPTTSTGLVLQQAGRILRPWEDVTPIILDHAGNLQRHGLPQDDRELSLAGDSRKKRDADLDGAKRCPDCGAELPRSASVCECGYVFGPGQGPETVITEADGDLVEISDDQDMRAALMLSAIEAEWRKKNARRDVPMRPGWIAHRYKERSGLQRLPSGYVLPALDARQAEARAAFDKLAREAERLGLPAAHAHLQFARRRADHVE